jgi:hypothetical protein
METQSPKRKKVVMKAVYEFIDGFLTVFVIVGSAVTIAFLLSGVIPR